MAWAANEPGTGMLAIGCGVTENHLAKQIPGANFSEADKIWRVPLSWPAYVIMRQLWSGGFALTESASLAAWAASAWNDTRFAYSMRAAMDAGSWVGDSIDRIEARGIGFDQMGSGRTLYPFQRGAVAWNVLGKRVADTDPPGLGKTAVVIRSFQVLRDQSPADGPGMRMLVIVRGSALYQWRDELASWAPELAVKVITGTAAQRKKIFEDGEADVWLITWPTLRYHTRLAEYHGTKFVRCPEHRGIDAKVTAGRCEVHEKELNQIYFDVVVADEAHAMADAKSKQTRAATWLAHRSHYFWPVTGTPVGDTVEDFWPIAHAIDPLAWPAKSRYMDFFAVKTMSWAGYPEVLGLQPEHEDTFHACAQPLLRRIPRELARPDMPARVPPVFRYPEMDPKQAKLYRQFRKELLGDVEPGVTMVPDNSAVLFMRLCQLAATMIKTEDGEDAAGFTKLAVELIMPSPKIADLVEYLGDEPGQLVVAVNSPRVARLAGLALDEAGITHTKITGEEDAQGKYDAQRWFKDGQARVIFITDAGGESVDLVTPDCNTIFFLQPEPSFLRRNQKTGRVDRIGQQFPVRTVWSLTPGTVEERLYALGCEKEERAGQVTRDADLLRWIVTGDDHDVEPSLAPADTQLTIPGL